MFLVTLEKHVSVWFFFFYVLTLVFFNFWDIHMLTDSGFVQLIMLLIVVLSLSLDHLFPLMHLTSIEYAYSDVTYVVC